MDGKCGCLVGNEVEAVREDEERVVPKTKCEHLDLGTTVHQTAPGDFAAWGVHPRERLSPVLVLLLPQSCLLPGKAAVTCAFFYVPVLWADSVVLPLGRLGRPRH